MIIPSHSVSSQIYPCVLLQGEITDDSWGPSGFYVLDGNLLLCLSYMKLVTSIPAVRKGDKITLYNCHKTRLGDGVVIMLCGQGFLVNDSMPDTSLYPKEEVQDTEDFLQDVALNYSCGFKLLYGLHILSKSICQHFTGIVPSDQITRYNPVPTLIQLSWFFTSFPYLNV